MTKEAFLKYTNIIIDNLEGGYYHPRMNIPAMGKSGETLFGVDREYEAPFVKALQPYKDFWALVDAQPKQTWKSEYMPGGALGAKLRSLIADFYYPWFYSLVNTYMGPLGKAEMEKNPKLQIHFIYAGAFNGIGWFKKFVTYYENILKTGNYDAKTLAEDALKARANAGNTILVRTYSKMLSIYKKYFAGNIATIGGVLIIAALFFCL